jgi:hypothetical protein
VHRGELSFKSNSSLNKNASLLQCGLNCHKECTVKLTVPCGPAKVPETSGIFGKDLCEHLQEVGCSIPPVVAKCAQEIDKNALTIKVLLSPAKLENSNDFVLGFREFIGFPASSQKWSSWSKTSKAGWIKLT